ncbi:hypothetical protein [Plantactinospora veratri]
MRPVTLARGTRESLRPLALAVGFVAVVEGLSLVEFLPLPVALLVAVGWGIGIGLLAVWPRGRATLAAWLEDGLVALGVVTMALFAFGGAAGLLMLDAALDSPTLTGQTLVLMFLPSIPVAIMGNVPTELLVIPVLLVLGWRPGDGGSSSSPPRRCTSYTESGPIWSSPRTDWTSPRRSARRRR